MPTSKKKNTSFTIIVLITSSIVTSALGLYFWKFYSYGLSNKTADWASFGAYVGGVLGTCFAFATFWMLLSTFRLQQKQSKNIEVQQFETTFYSLLELHNQKLSELDLDPDKIKKLFDDDPRIGQALSMSDDEFEKVSDSSVFQSKEEKYGATEKYLEELQREILEDIELSQYFRILYQLLKYIARNNIQNPNHNFDAKHLNNMSNLSIEYEKMYSSIVRGFVPVSLLPIIALNCIPTPNGLENLDKYQALLERYNFLEHIRFDLLPKRLASFLILNNYNYALGDNKQVIVMAPIIQKNYEEYPLKPYSYFIHSSLSNMPASKPISTKKINKKPEVFFDKLKESFYDDDSINEVIFFLISGISTSVFYLTVAAYVKVNFDRIVKTYSSSEVLLIVLFAIILCVIAIYIITITGGRLANTLGKKNVSDRKAIALIGTITPIAFFTIFIYILILSPMPSSEKTTQIQIENRNSTSVTIQQPIPKNIAIDLTIE